MSDWYEQNHASDSRIDGYRLVWGYSVPMSRKNRSQIKTRTISGRVFTLEESHQLLSSIITSAKDGRDLVNRAFKEPWNKKPSLIVGAAFGLWITQSTRSLSLIILLAENHDLIMEADVNLRKMVEILLQVRKLADSTDEQRDYLATKFFAWACADYLDKLALIKEKEFKTTAYESVLRQYEQFDHQLRDEISRERSKRGMYWFGDSWTGLAKSVSRGTQNLASAYKLLSSESHGVLDAILDVRPSSKNTLSFKGYSNKAELNQWAAEKVDRGHRLCVDTWNSVAHVVEAKLVRFPPPTDVFSFQGYQRSNF